MLHVLLYIALCCLPALILLPLRILDREPRNEITHESGDGRDGPHEDEPDGLLLAA